MKDNQELIYIMLATMFVYSKYDTVNQTWTHNRRLAHIGVVALIEYVAVPAIKIAATGDFQN